VKLTVFTDGASKGNPGVAGIGIVFYRDSETEPLATIAERIPDTTNNVAEYKALLRGLSEALLRGADEVAVRTDSELMAKQINGQYAVKSADLQPLFFEAKQLLARFEKAEVKHIFREANAIADKLANQGVKSPLT
jgi:ribonuclease HI